MKFTKQPILALTIATLLFSACKEKHNGGSDHLEGFVTVDTANVMIKSYLESIDSNQSAKPSPDLYSLIMDADELRTYLERNPEIKNVKFMFAHTLDYIHAGNAGKPAGMRSDALTIIVAGYDRQNNYIFSQGNMVPNHSVPCPRNCPDFGTASSNLLK